MSHLSKENKEALLLLKKIYPELREDLPPGDPLTSALNAMDGKNPSLESAWPVCQAYAQNIQAYAVHVENFYYTGLAESLQKLQEAGLLNGEQAQANFDAMAGHQYSWEVADALEVLQKAGLLNGEQAKVNRAAVVGHQSPRDVADVLEILQEVGLLSTDQAQANRDALLENQDLDQDLDLVGIEYALRELQAAGLLSGEQAQANFDAVVAHKAPWNVAKNIEKLTQSQIMGDTLEIKQDEFEQMVKGKLQVADDVLDKELTGLLGSPEKKQSAEEEVVEKPQTKEAHREARLRFFDGKQASPDQEKSNKPTPPKHSS